MMLLALSTILMLTQVAASVHAKPQQTSAAPAAMKCETGPAHRALGGTQWLIYSCDDQASMVVIAAQDNPASPFYFLLKAAGGTYAMSGEGTGDQKASDAAGDALSKMTPVELAALFAETKASIR